ncbi:MAG: hypothetical protein HY301_05735 [Verrucomicrobia bacterium]|nr:hypothetical protein [Verrucomicrobiota bacterium]
MLLFRRAIFFAAVSCAGFNCGVHAEGIEAGPLFHEFGLTLETGRGTEALGPLFYEKDAGAIHQWGIPPLMSGWRDLEADAMEFDLLYPLFTVDRFGAERRWQFFQLLSISDGQNQEQTGPKRFTVFPFYFQQRSADPSLNYTAVIPFYGTIRNRLFRDEVRFVLMPLYVQSRKGDVVTDNYLYPFFHLRRGNALSGWQFWPLYGEEHRAVTTRTNVIEELEIVGGHDKYFALWFLFMKETSGIGTDNPDHRLASLPLFSLQRSTARDATTVLWPFFTFIDDRAEHYREWQVPWPFFVIAKSDGGGENRHGWRLWPFYSDMRSRTLRRNYLLWPLYVANSVDSPPFQRERVKIAEYLYSDLTEKNTTTGAVRRRTDVWPLFTAQRDLEGNERFQMLALLEPVLPTSKSIERNWSPVWSLWRSEKNAKTGAASQSLLWNLYRADATPDSRKCSLLFGLFQYQSDRDGQRWRLFYVPLGKSRGPASTGPKPN